MGKNFKTYKNSLKILKLDTLEKRRAMSTIWKEMYNEWKN